MGSRNHQQQFDLAMRGGLGFDPRRSWLEFFESLGSETIRELDSKMVDRDRVHAGARRTAAAA